MACSPGALNGSLDATAAEDAAIGVDGGNELPHDSGGDSSFDAAVAVDGGTGFDAGRDSGVVPGTDCPASPLANAYYVAADGSDTNPGTCASPWQSIAKVNATALSPGTSVLFRRGDRFYGALVVSQSGSSGSPITFGSYGAQSAKPVITGFTQIAEWTGMSGNVWESTNACSTLAYTNMVVVGGVNTAMGRFPNTGYLTYDMYSGTTSITSSALSGTPNWTGAELAMFAVTYGVARNVITAHSGGTLTYTTVGDFPGIQYSGQGFIIQNDARTLDVQNEWYYSPGTHKLRIFSATMPTDVLVPTVEKLLTVSDQNYVTVTDLAFEGSNNASIALSNAQHVSIQNCDFDFSGKDGIMGEGWTGNSTALLIEGCTFNHTNNNAIGLGDSFDHATIRANTIENSGTMFGMGASGRTLDGAGNSGAKGISGAYSGILTGAPGSIIEFNTVRNSGYLGIRFSEGANVTQNNFIETWCSVLKDGGGIYTWNYGVVDLAPSYVRNNILISTVGDNPGIYMDDHANHVEVAGNSVFTQTADGQSNHGIFLHNNWNDDVHDNTLFGNALGLTFWSETYDENYTGNIGHQAHDNIVVANAGQATLTVTSSFTGVLTADNNYYARPIDDTDTLAWFNSATGMWFPRGTLAQWQAWLGQDSHSHTSPRSITSASDLRFEYNATSSTRTVSLDASYIDVRGTVYASSITLAPYTSAVLIRNR